MEKENITTIAFSENETIPLLKEQEFSYNILAESQQSSSSNKMLQRHAILSRCKENLQVQFINLSDDVINDANELIYYMLFESQENSWWKYVRALSNYIDWVYEHSINVAFLSFILASQLNYSAQKRVEICMGALFHDIGKILIPEEIIQKPGSLTEEEMSIVKQHCKFGFDILKGSNLPACCKDVVIQHHERLDGSGYPYGLTKTHISSCSKIVMIADVLDAITAYRPYKQKKKMDIAISELKNSGNQFDQELVGKLPNLLNIKS